MPRTTLPNIGAAIAPRTTCPESFGVSISFQASEAIVAVRGDLDSASVPTLRTVLHGLVDGGHHSIVLDLDAVSFVSAAGFGVMVAIRAHLQPHGGRLLLRSVPARVSYVLGLLGLETWIEIEAEDEDAMLRARLTRIARASGVDRAIDAQLSLLVDVAAATIDGADGVSVTLDRRGLVSTVAASNDVVLRMDAHQYATGEGPCLSAARDARAYDIDALSRESRWPAFVPLAAAEGISSILSSPLVAAGRSVGALNVYSSHERAFGGAQRELAVLLANHASNVVGDVPEPDEEMAARITDGLCARLVIAQAQGALMERRHISEDDATASLHRTARAGGSSVREHATRLVASTQAVIGPSSGVDDG